MDLTQQEIQVLLEIIDNVSIPVKQSREIVQPIITKLQVQLARSNQPIPTTEPEATTQGE